MDRHARMDIANHTRKVRLRQHFCFSFVEQRADVSYIYLCAMDLDVCVGEGGIAGAFCVFDTEACSVYETSADRNR